MSSNLNQQENEPAPPPVQAGKAPNGIVKIEGQEIPLREEIVADDALLKKTLRPYYAAIMSASITRRREGNVLIATVVKRADYKGARLRKQMPPPPLPASDGDFTRPIIDAIWEAESFTNPALELARRLQLQLARGRISFAAIDRMGPEIDRALATGEEEAKLIRSSVARLKQAPPIPATATPAGF